MKNQKNVSLGNNNGILQEGKLFDLRHPLLGVFG